MLQGASQLWPCRLCGTVVCVGIGAGNQTHEMQILLRLTDLQAFTESQFDVKKSRFNHAVHLLNTRLLWQHPIPAAHALVCKKRASSSGEGGRRGQAVKPRTQRSDKRRRHDATTQS